MNSRRKLIFIGLMCFSVLTLLAAPFVGMTELKWEDLFQSIGQPTEHTSATIFWKLRLPRVILAFVSGAVLALGGLVFQVMFRNILATPFTLGVSSGAAFGASLYFKCGLVFGWRWMSGSALCAFIGACLTMLGVGAFASSRFGFSSVTILLAGVMVSFFFSSLLLLLQYLGDAGEVFQMTRWLMGSLDIVGFDSLLGVLPLIAISLITILIFVPALDLLALGDEAALSRGLELKKIRWILFVATSIGVGSIVSIAGPIGFVGLMVPYFCRQTFGPSHRILFFAASCGGGAFLTICDTVARTAFAPSEIPVGVITALSGGPFFLWLLRRTA